MRIAALALVLTIAAPLARAQKTTQQVRDDVVTIGENRFTLGMTKESVMDALARDYDVKLIDDAHNAWAIRRRSDPRSIVGNVAFDGSGRLVYAMKHWILSDRSYSAAEVGTALYGAMATFVKEGRTECSIQATESQTPGPVTETKTVFISCGRKFIDVTVETEGAGSSLDISEGLMAPHAARQWR